MIRSSNYWRVAAYVVVLASGFILLFYNLDSHLLWGDEAETATLARNVLRFGIPKSFDGLNQITLLGSKNDSNAHGIWIWSPWLQEYVAAGAFSIFGATTWSARAPFALVGWASLGLLGLIAYRIYRDHRIALGSMALLATSEVFLLHARQCRYYSISVLGQILFCYGIYQLLSQDGRGVWTFAGALVLHFYANYIIALADVPVLLPLAWTLYRRDKRTVLWVAECLGLLTVAAAPWLVYARPWRQSGAIGAENRLAKLGAYFSEFHFHFLPWVFLLLPLGAWLFAWRKSRVAFGRQASSEGKWDPGSKKHAAWQSKSPVCLLEWHLAALIPLYLALITIAPGKYIRYEVPLAPVACLLAAAWAFRYLRWQPFAIGLLMVQATTNLLALGTGWFWRGNHGARAPLIEYIAGLMHPYADRFADVIAFLDQEARPGESVFVYDPELPMIFYTRLRIIDGRFRPGLPNTPPDWLLPESPSGVVDQRSGPLPDVLKPYYDTLTIPVHNSTRRGSLPDPDTYQYRTSQSIETFTLYRKKEGLER